MASFSDFRAWGRYFAAPIRKGWDAFIDLLQSSTGQSIKAPYKFKSETTTSDPGAGYLKINNVDPSLATSMSVSKEASNGISNALMLGAIRANDFVQVGSIVDDTSYLYQAAGEAVDMGGWATIELVYVSHTGTFLNEQDVEFAMIVYSANTFSELSDTPDQYLGYGGSTVIVKPDETGLEYGDLAPSVLTYPYRWQTALTPPPSAGHIEQNNADPTLATELYISTEDDDGINREIALGIPKRGDAVGFLDSNSDKAYSYSLTGNPVPNVTPNPDYFTYPVVNIGVRGTFANNERGFLALLVLGANEFTELLDTPDDYAGEAGKIVTVNETEDGLEFNHWLIDPTTGALYPSGGWATPGIGSIDNPVDFIGIGRQETAGIEGIITHRDVVNGGGIGIGGFQGEGNDPQDPSFNAPVELLGSFGLLMADQLAAKSSGAFAEDHYLKAGPTEVLPDGRVAYPIQLGPAIIYSFSDDGTDTRDIDLNETAPATSVVQLTTTHDYTAGSAVVSFGLQCAELGGRTGTIVCEFWADGVYRGETQITLNGAQQWFTDNFATNSPIPTGIVIEIRCYYTETNPLTDCWILGATRTSEIKIQEGSTGGGGGSTTFVALTDTPASYTDQATNLVSVNTSANALVFQGQKRVKEGNLIIEKANTPFLYLREIENQTNNVSLMSYNAGTGTWSVKSNTGQVIHRIDPLPAAAGNALIQIMRTTNTTGSKQITIYAGDSSSTITAQFNAQVGGPTYLNNQGGICFIGAESERLRVQNGDITFQTAKGLLGVDARPLYNSAEIALLSDVTGGGSLPHTVAVDLQEDTITTDTWATIINATGSFVLNLIEVRSVSSTSTVGVRVYIDGVLVIDIESFTAPNSTGDYSRVIGPGGAEILSSLMASTSLRIDLRKFTSGVPNVDARTQYQEVGF